MGSWVYGNGSEMVGGAGPWGAGGQGTSTSVRRAVHGCWVPGRTLTMQKSLQQKERSPRSLRHMVLEHRLGRATGHTQGLRCQVPGSWSEGCRSGEICGVPSLIEPETDWTVWEDTAPHMLQRSQGGPLPFPHLPHGRGACCLRPITAHRGVFLSILCDPGSGTVRDQGGG